jgi:hypothetical protein
VCRASDREKEEKRQDYNFEKGAKYLGKEIESKLHREKA